MVGLRLRNGNYRDEAVGLLRNLINVLGDAIKNGYLIVIIAEDIEQEALATLFVYKLKGALKIAALKALGFGERKKQYLDDIAILIGGTVIRDEVGLTLDKVDSSVLGMRLKLFMARIIQQLLVMEVHKWRW
ncbi:hypothetical protein L2E82_00413 [Cichorium intybus]|uniref:Uncharacterized protein n=1 Tax=Cichorium intybus TaxID=13427 RepID=A0ACB9GX26_CICIN|nr:hypothetical protein L2E82_00413 [Cichorium intybus]